MLAERIVRIVRVVKVNKVWKILNHKIKNQKIYPQLRVNQIESLYKLKVYQL